jgi:hypothetical protein
MTEITPLHTPKWRLVDDDWHMLVGNRSVAHLQPIPLDLRGPCPWANWLSVIHPGDYEAHGWHAVDFATLADGQRDLEQWWGHTLRGETYRPDTGEAQNISRWTGEPLGETAGVTQSAGIGQSHH